MRLRAFFCTPPAARFGPESLNLACEQCRFAGEGAPLRGSRSRQEVARMQMGPALLPTPLSPTRGLLSCSSLRLPGSANAWRPMFPRCLGRARLSGSSPALAPASDPAACQNWPEGRFRHAAEPRPINLSARLPDRCAHQPRPWRASPMSGRINWPAAICFRGVLKRPICIWPKPLASGPRSPRGQ